MLPASFSLFLSLPPHCVPMLHRIKRLIFGGDGHANRIKTTSERKEIRGSFNDDVDELLKFSTIQFLDNINKFVK